MKVGIQKVPRDGSDPGDSEDSVAFSFFPFCSDHGVPVINPQLSVYEYPIEEGFKFCCALADGAGSTFAPGSWADLLTSHFFMLHPPFDSSGLLRWARRLGAFRRKELESENLPWYAQEKLRRRGSASTLVGISIETETSDSGRWNALGLGDSVLLYISDGNLEKSLPNNLSKLEGSPALLSIDSEYNETSSQYLHRLDERKCRKGDLFVLASDALGEWLLRKGQQDPPDWDSLIGELEENFESKVSDLQKKGEVDRDDVTLATVRLN